MTSSAKLLELAGEALDDGRNPLANPFLADNDVSFDQCMQLAEHLAAGARIMARAIREPQSPEAAVMFAEMLRGPS